MNTNFQNPYSGYPMLELDAESLKVFTTLRVHKAMSVLEISGVTGIYGEELKKVLVNLSEKKLITEKPYEAKKPDLTTSIVSISGSYF